MSGIVGCLMLLAGWCCPNSGWAAVSGSHYTWGIEAVQAASVPPPGLYYRMYNIWYNPTESRNNSGGLNPGKFNLNLFASVQRLIHVTETKILGGNVFYSVIVPLIDADLTVGNDNYSNSFTVGDLEFEPGLAWHLPQWDFAFTLAVDAPTGQFRASEPTSPGMGYWTGRVSAGATYYFDEQKTWSLSVLGRVLFNSTQKDTNVRPGTEFVAEYGLGKEFQVNNWMIRPGLAGASYWQIADDSNSNLAYGIIADQHKRAQAAGAELNILYVPWAFQANLRCLQDYAVDNGTNGTRIVLTLTKTF